jgi:CRP-like cAMP-binding protein
VAGAEEAVQRLGAVDLFEGLPTNVLVRIALLGGERRFEAGEDIVREGDVGGGLFLIFEGEAVVTVGGQERARLGPDDYFGEI